MKRGRIVILVLWYLLVETLIFKVRAQINGPAHGQPDVFQCISNKGEIKRGVG